MKSRRTDLWPLAIPVMALALAAAPLHAIDGGATPYPDANSEAAWPGKGPIRVFGWMAEARARFWKQRENDQGAVVFVGDALTSEWDAKQMAEAFPGLKVANRGVAGDVSRGVLFRFGEDVLDLFSPLATPGGKPAARFFAKDRIHLANPGYQKWAELLRPALEKLAVPGRKR
jgi:hypothetical protein